MKPTLELDNLSVGYGRRVLLKDLCATILPGQILTLIGPNGAGKSTILKTISHHLACMGGVVRIGGENIERMDSYELAKRLSVVLTERVRPELMTCYDVAASGRYPYTGRFGMLTALDRDVIAQSLALVRVKELGGQAVRPRQRRSASAGDDCPCALPAAACAGARRADLLSGYSI